MDVHKKGNEIIPWYFFEFDKLNEIGFSDDEMLSFIEEMKAFAQKDIEERKNKSKAKEK